MSRIIILTLLILSISLTATASWLSDFVDKVDDVELQNFHTQTRGYVTLGSLSHRTPVRKDPFVTIQPPKVDVGCGGIDIFLGGISFLDADYMVEKLKRVLESAPYVAFDLGLKTLCSECSEVLKTAEMLMNDLNSMDFDECALAQGSVQTIVDNAEVLKNGASPKDLALKAANDVKSGINNFWEKYSDKSPTEKREELEEEKSKTLPPNTAIKYWYDKGGSLLNALADKGSLQPLSTLQIEMVRAQIGDMHITRDGKMRNFRVIDPCPELTNYSDFNSIIKHNIIIQTAIGESYNCSESLDNMYKLVSAKMTKLQDIMKSDKIIPVDLRSFISISEIPVYLILKNAYTIEGAAGGDSKADLILPPVTASYYYVPVASSIEAAMTSVSSLISMIGEAELQEQTVTRLKNYNKSIASRNKSLEESYQKYISTQKASLELIYSINKTIEESKKNNSMN